MHATHDTGHKIAVIRRIRHDKAVEPVERLLQPRVKLQLRFFPFHIRPFHDSAFTLANRSRSRA